MSLPTLTIADFTLPIPIIQGGMGIGISLSQLSGTVASCGGMGIISTAQIGFQLPEFERNPLRANLKAIGLELEKARAISDGGIVGFNVMASTYQYERYLKECVTQGADVIISGGGLPTVLPQYTKGTTTKIAPIVSSAKGCKVILNYWHKKYQTMADFVVVEGPLAGGHLGFKLDQLADPEFDMDAELVKIIAEVKKFANLYEKEIPVIFGGGVYSHDDILHYLSLGCAGVQMATRFVVTEECDAPAAFKKAYLNSKPEDLKIIKSPVGMPARAINNYFTQISADHQIPIEKCRNCLSYSHCDRKTIPYCISEHLLKSAGASQEDPANGLLFAGANVYRLQEMTTASDLMTELCGN